MTYSQKFTLALAALIAAAAFTAGAAKAEDAKLNCVMIGSVYVCTHN